MKKYLLNTVKFFAFLSVGILLLWLAFRGVKMDSFLNSFHHIKIGWIILPFLFSFSAFWIRAFRWQLLIEPLGYSTSLLNAYHAVSMGYFANFAFPRIGEITRCGVLNRTDKVPFDALIGTVITERIFDLLMLLLSVVIVFVIKINFFGSFLTQNIFQPMWAKMHAMFSSLWIPALILVALFVAMIAVVIMFKHRIKKITMVQKMHALVKGILQGLLSFRHMQKKGLFLLHTFLLWFCYFVMSWLPFYSMEATSHLTAIDGLFMLVLSGLAITAPVQGGIGVFHALISFALVSLYGLTKEEALAFSIILHESQSIFYILLGIISFAFLTLKKNNQQTILSKK